MNQSGNIHEKPRLVFFQYKYGQNMSDMVRFNRDQQTKCLSHFFETVVVQDDCDFQEICDKYQPDLTLFEMMSGGEHAAARRPEIANVSSLTRMPKLGFLNADAFCEARAGFISDMERWGIDAAFSIATTAAEHTPALADLLFTWPNFVDPEVFKDYGVPKIIPVLFTGSQISLYPWRRQILRLVSQYYPSLISPHRGYGMRYGAFQMPVGEPYARTINASWFVPSCGTVAKEVVRKQFEIPASRACLITEKSPGLEAAGFIDMQNCVFADQSDVLDKLQYLFEHPSELAEITDAGYQLVHGGHTHKQRDQILQWYSLNLQVKPDQKIIQPGPFQPLAIVPKSSPDGNSYLRSNGLHLMLLREADAKLAEGKYDEAEHLYLGCLNYIPWMPEPKLKLALCNLYKGNARRALSWLCPPIKYVLHTYKAADPDPVEWAYFIIAHLCLGKRSDAGRYAKEFPWLRHPELDRARWAANALTQGRSLHPPKQEERTRYRRSVHQLPDRGIDDWIAHIKTMLGAAGQSAAAGTLTRCLAEEVAGLTEGYGSSACERGDQVPVHARSPIAVCTSADQSAAMRWRFKVRKRISQFLHRLERKHGYFLPYRFSDMRNDEFLEAVRTLAATEEMRAALVLGASRGEGITEAFLAGILENWRKPSLFCINGPTRGFVKLEKAYAGNSSVKFCGISAGTEEQYASEVQRAINSLSQDGKKMHFDVIVIDGSQLAYELPACRELLTALQRTSCVILDDINTMQNFSSFTYLLENPAYFLAAHDPGLRNGYAIFKKVSAT